VRVNIGTPIRVSQCRQRSQEQPAID